MGDWSEIHTRIHTLLAQFVHGDSAEPQHVSLGTSRANHTHWHRLCRLGWDWRFGSGDFGNYPISRGGIVGADLFSLPPTRLHLGA